MSFRKALPWTLCRSLLRGEEVALAVSTLSVSPRDRADAASARRERLRIPLNF